MKQKNSVHLVQDKYMSAFTQWGEILRCQEAVKPQNF